ncbi:DUF1801 domain-containing protein [Corynebacterium sp. 35RC1]|nr:DUF1801 domain-containing protein [Corynebacterium sp. 35RC1]
MSIESGTALDSIKGLGAPARGALVAAGYTCLEQLDGAQYEQLLALHGVGKRGLERVHAALEERGMGLAGSIPKPEPLGHKVTRGHTGEVAKDIKTRPTEESPADHVASLPWERRVHEGEVLLELFERATGEPAVMWGTGMVGFGATHYESTSGRHGDWFLVGFRLAKAKISLYGLKDFPDLLEKMGKHSTGVSCVYVNKLEDISLEVLEELVRREASRELK